MEGVAQQNSPTPVSDMLLRTTAFGNSNDNRRRENRIRRRRDGAHEVHPKSITNAQQKAIRYIAEGMSNKDIVLRMTEEGTPMGYQRVSELRNDSLAQLRINEIAAAIDGDTIATATKRRLQGEAAMDILFQAATGKLPKVHLDDNGFPIESGEDGNPLPTSYYAVTDPKERIAAAKVVAAACPDTAPVAKVQQRIESDPARAAAADDLRARFQAALLDAKPKDALDVTVSNG